MSIRLIRLPQKKITGGQQSRGSIAGTCKLPHQGNRSAPIMIVVDPYVYTGDFAPTSKHPMNERTLSKLAPYMKRAGIKGSDVVFIAACQPVEKETWGSDSRLGKAIKADNEEFMRALRQLKPRLVIAQGKAAIRQVLNRPAKITKMRGLAFHDANLNTVVMPTLGIGHVMTVPEHGELLDADLRTAARIIENGYQVGAKVGPVKSYKWCFDLAPVLALKKKGTRMTIGLDTEATCFEAAPFPHYYVKETVVLTVQITVSPGVSYVVPIDYPGMPNPERAKCIRQLKQLLEDKEVDVVGQNLKYDWLLLKHKLGIHIANYADDILLLAHMLNENMLSKSLDDICRIFLPEMGGYKDEFHRLGYNMGRMDLVKPEHILAYSGADSDAVFQLLPILRAKLEADPKLLNCYNRVVMPALRAFCDIEPRGFKVNRAALRALYLKIEKKQKAEFAKLIKFIPKEIVDEYRETGVGLKLTRDALIRAFLFTDPRGLRIKPTQFTKTKLPSTSTKTHLPYFIGKHKGRHLNPVTKKVEEFDFIADLIKFIKNDKMHTTYVGQDTHYETDKHGERVQVPATGFWQYIYEEYIRPSYILHGTVTGRTASKDPNGQNFPKRGEFADEYRAIFEAPAGWTLLEADYSQLELRIAGIMANEPTFIKTYREGGDIHCLTASIVMGMTIDQFMALKKTDPAAFKLGRFKAKAVNFGFLYGMGWRKFMIYAKTTYEVDFTEQEAQNIRTAFFSRYRFKTWHDAVKAFVRIHKYVRCIDGRVRHLPAVVVDDEGIASSAERQAVNSPVQGSGSDFGLIALTRINNELPKDIVRVVGFIHDAIVCIAKEGREMEAARSIKQYMENNPLKEWFGFTSPIPFTADVALGKNLSKMIELESEWIKDTKLVSFAQVKAIHDSKKAPAKKPFKVHPLPVRKAA